MKRAGRIWPKGGQAGSTLGFGLPQAAGQRGGFRCRRPHTGPPNMKGEAWWLPKRRPGNLNEPKFESPAGAVR